MSLAENFKRYRFSVPNADESVTNWILAQSNLSQSIRELIKTAIRCNGFTDVACYPVRQIVPAMQGGMPIEIAMLSQAAGGQILPNQLPQQQAQYQPPVSPTAAPSVAPAYPLSAAQPQPAPVAAPVVPPVAAPVLATPAPVVPQPISVPAETVFPQEGQPDPNTAPVGETAPKQDFCDPSSILDD